MKIPLNFQMLDMTAITITPNTMKLIITDNVYISNPYSM